MRVELTVNGEKHTVECPPHKRLLDVLRLDLGLTGSKEGCGEGECGACTVLIDDRPANSCLIPAGQAHGKHLTTVEGLAEEGSTELTAIQSALVKHGGTQCGICTPGIAVCATHILDQEPDASHSRIRELLAGNLCRCTGYQLVVESVVAAAKEAKAR